MKYVSLIILFVCVFFSCEKNCDCVAPPFSDSCLGDSFDEFRANPQAIRIDEYTKNGESYYLLDAGESHYDGTSPILNTKCDSVCYFGGWVQQTCFQEMTFKQNIWTR